MALKIIAAPALGDVAQGVAGLFGGGLQALGFSPDSKLLLVRGVYSDSAYPLLASRTAFWVYDIKLDQYSACVNKLVTSDRPIEVSDVAIATFNGQTQLIASYRDTGATALNLNKLALIRNGVLVNSDLVSLVSGNQADGMVDAIRVSANGRFVAIETAASNLTAELDTNGLKDIFFLIWCLTPRGASPRSMALNRALTACWAIFWWAQMAHCQLLLSQRKYLPRRTRTGQTMFLFGGYWNLNLPSPGLER